MAIRPADSISSSDEPEASSSGCSPRSPREGGGTADVGRRGRQLHVLVGIFVIKVLKRNHLLGLDGRIRAKGRFFCPPSNSERFEPLREAAEELRCGLKAVSA